MRRTKLDRIVFGAALVAALGSSVGFGWLGRTSIRKSRPATADANSTDYIPAEVATARNPREKWQRPHAQTRGPEWIYDVFTPPEIGYDDQRRQFTVALPGNSRGPDRTAPAPDFVLLEVKREAFRLQLIGYVGGDGDYRGAFENSLTAEVFLGGTGLAVPGLDLVITSFAVERRPLPGTDGTPLNQWVATAVVHDERTGENQVLTAGERAFTGELRAVLAQDPDEHESVVELRKGDEFQTADHAYRVEGLQWEPPAADLIQLPSTGAVPLRLSLTPTLATQSSDANPSDSIAADDR